jgi:thioredoxin reductase
LALRAVNELSLVAESVNLVIRSGEILETRLARHFLGNSKVVVWEGYSVEEILGDDFAERLVVKSPEGTREELAVDGIFVELGLIPNSDMVRDLVDLDEKGRVMVDNANRTSCPGLFAAGDVTDAHAEQVLIAVGEGAKAALSAFDYLLPVL